MSDVVEKNDVDISKIFGWGRVFEVVNPQTDEVDSLVYMRLLGDADLGRARVHAMRKSAELRRKLKDTNSDEYLAWVRDIDDVNEEDLIKLIIIFSGRELSLNAKASVKIPVPKPPKSNAKLEKLEKFQEEVDSYGERKSKAIHDALDKEVAKLKANLESKSKEELYRMYVRLLVEEFCEREAMLAFEDMCTCLSCYTDDTYKIKFFNDYEEYNNLLPIQKQQFKDAYRSIDMELSELKKLRRATP